VSASKASGERLAMGCVPRMRKEKFAAERETVSRTQANASVETGGTETFARLLAQVSRRGGGAVEGMGSVVLAWE